MVKQTMSNWMVLVACNCEAEALTVAAPLLARELLRLAAVRGLALAVGFFFVVAISVIRLSV
jgi:hypothetical protein